MGFQKGNSYGVGGNHGGAGRPSKEEAAIKIDLRRAAHELLISGTTKAINRLLRCVESKNEAIAVRAATTILDFGFKSFETEELEQRIRALEERLQEAK
jgi:hypothetical protein